MAFHTLTVAAVERLCDDAAAVTFEVPAELRDEYSFAAGQSLALRRVVDGVEERRSYSICASVGERPRVGVREVPDGLFSTWLVREVRPGTRIEVQTPTGRFRADPAAGGRHLCIAAGSGITPVLSIASSLLAGSPTAQVTLIYGNRRSATVMFADELADLKDRYGARFELVHVLSREPRDVELLSGRLDGDRLRTLLDLLVPLDAVDHVWLCGPYPMVEQARTVLAELGLPPERVHRELFFVDEPPPPVEHAEAQPTGQTSEVTLTIDGRSSTAALPRDKSILDGAQAVRSDLPFACKGGVCGTCRALVKDGTVDMRRNYALEAAEVAAGFVLTCQSHPVSDEVSVDYDA
jgi:ring-1,2-phenylacetyl-CoA epoxidase subunit PaaE